MTPGWTETHVSGPYGKLERVYRKVEGDLILTLDASTFDRLSGDDMDGNLAREWANFLRVTGHA